MIEKIRCIDANAKELAIISNSILKNSRKFAEQALSKGLILTVDAEAFSAPFAFSENPVSLIKFIEVISLNVPFPFTVLKDAICPPLLSSV